MEKMNWFDNFMYIPQRLNHSCRHWTPHYIYNRLGVIWYEFKKPDVPWLTKPAIEILNSWLLKEDVGFEWGSGRSTLWFARRVRHLTSVESSEYWFKKLSHEIEELKLDNITYLYKPDVESGMNSNYVRVVHEFAASSLDFALVDGTLRDFCALAVLPLLKPGGILIIDNADWFFPHETDSPNIRTESQGTATPYWEEFLNQIRNWRCIWTTNGVWDTAIWVKPVS